ncbi:O-acyltransferase domain containing protein, putative [Entamoeba invadens IP1]|uniref:O-acyltransferase domain containing protein, putative n=1 Tax=Entamoeba invadens IP1 TaxID=370355 RepID=UPI0002C3EE09|nr:O-acyltransferase domain containing protein, putative [Entamoeba invadens IP1]ELP94218.1 O-acyltransferase domain containing protein, putative [Entamoeba invadens IP1]|eukprot:XP_004260989.1 O-acyltransferase domain containing protein, putative [Entamoeba invadens IP1]
MSLSLIDLILNPISKVVHVPVDYLKYFSSFVLAIPITYYCRFLPNDCNLKHKVYGIIGLLMSFIVFGPISLSVVFLAYPIYYIMKAFPTKRMALTMMVFLILHLSLVHLHKVLSVGVLYKLAFDTVHMMFVIRFSTFCWSVADANSDQETLCEHRKKMQIKTYPTLTEYFGYVFFFPGIFSGPSLEFNNYMDFITMKQFEKMPAEKKEGNLPIIPLDVFARRLGAGIAFYMLVWVVSIFEPKQIEYYVLNEKDTTSFWFKMFCIWYTGEICLSKYIGTWYVADAMSIVGGFGYSGEKDGKSVWKNFLNLDFPTFYLSTSFRNSIFLWNRNVQSWLANYVYLNLEGTIFDSWKTVITNLVSAFWHGFYAGYYISFGTLALHTETSKLIFKKLTPYVAYKSNNNKTVMSIYNTILIVYTNYSVKYNFAPFFVMNFWTAWEIFKQTYFCIHLITLGLFVWLTFAPPRVPKGTTTTKVKKEE